MIPSSIRSDLEARLRNVVVRTAPELGYSLESLAFADAIELTLLKNQRSFVVWIKAASDATNCFRATARFKLGHRGEPTDDLGFKLLSMLCDTVEEFDVGSSDEALRSLFSFAGTGLKTSPAPSTAAQLEPAAVQALEESRFSPLHEGWVEERDAALRRRFRSLPSRTTIRILVVNATKGLLFYPSIVDFFAHLARACPGVRLTTASYFEGIFQFHEEVRRKGLRLVPIAEITSWPVDRLNEFDAILMIGPSQLTAAWMSMPGLKSRLYLLDLGFYHQFIEAHPQRFYADAEALADTGSQIHPVTAYSCQPRTKVEHDFRRICALPLLRWRWFDYIPIGFGYCRYYKVEAHAFDIALLGRAGRDYSLLHGAPLREKRLLFLGSPSQSPDLDRLRRELNVTVASGLDADIYARLLAASRCVVLPAPLDVRNVFLSVVDAVASGVPLVTSRHVGLARMAENGLPAIFHDGSGADIARKTLNLLAAPEQQEELARRSLQFAQEHLDIYEVMWTILTALLDEAA